MYRETDTSSLPLSDRAINGLPSRCIIRDVRVGSPFVCPESPYAAQLYIRASFIQASLSLRVEGQQAWIRAST